MVMKTSDFYFDLPDELIAQTPLKERDTSRLLCLSKETGEVSHRIFKDIVSQFSSGDLLVFNNTKVIPARIYCRKKETGAAIEILFTERVHSEKWVAIAKPAKRLKIGTEVILDEEGKDSLFVDEIHENGSRTLISKNPKKSIDDLLEIYGNMPLPPYITREAKKSDYDTYQTVYAEKKGAIAAPTAGLHFTNDLLESLKEKGIESAFVTLHVGIGTFRPVKEEDPLKHPMHEEKYEINDETAQLINKVKERGNKVIAVGTTSVRVLEHCASISSGGKLKADEGKTSLMILPGHQFKIVDSLITNFHLPCSTLMMLVSALSKKDNIINAYNSAVKEKYRFFSYGDAMLID